MYYAFNYNLYKLNTANGSSQLIGSLGTYNSTNIQFFAMVEVGGTLYGVDANDRIFTVDTTTGLATFKAQISSASAPGTPLGVQCYGLAPSLTPPPSSPTRTILWRNTTTGEDLVWYMNGVSQTGSADLYQVADQTWTIVGTGDFNGGWQARHRLAQHVNRRRMWSGT